jgi:hypothetical protein
MTDRIKFSPVKESGSIVCECGCDVTEPAVEVMLHNENVGSLKCQSCDRILYFSLLRGDFNKDFCEFAYSFEPFPDVCTQLTELPRCPNCGHEFGYEELYPHASAKEIFTEIAWDMTEDDYDTVKEAVVVCPYCREAMSACMHPPDLPQPKFSTYQRVARLCQTCGKPHNFHITRRTEHGVMLVDNEDTGHFQEEWSPGSP